MGDTRKHVDTCRTSEYHRRCVGAGGKPKENMEEHVDTCGMSMEDTRKHVDTCGLVIKCAVMGLGNGCGAMWIWDMGDEFGGDGVVRGVKSSKTRTTSDLTYRWRMKEQWVMVWVPLLVLFFRSSLVPYVPYYIRWPYVQGCPRVNSRFTRTRF